MEGGGGEVVRGGGEVAMGRGEVVRGGGEVVRGEGCSVVVADTVTMGEEMIESVQSLENSRDGCSSRLVTSKLSGDTSMSM